MSFKDIYFLLRKCYLQIHNTENSSHYKQILKHLVWEQQGQAIPGAGILPVSQENYFQSIFPPRYGCWAMKRVFLLFGWLIGTLIWRIRLWKSLLETEFLFTEWSLLTSAILWATVLTCNWNPKVEFENPFSLPKQCI